MPVFSLARSLFAGVSLIALSQMASAEGAGAYLASRTAVRANDFAAAAQYSAQALVADPTSAYLQETTVLMDIAQGEFARALALSQQIGSAKDGNQTAALMLIADEAKAGAWDKVLARIEAGVNVGPMIESLLQAWALEGAGKASQAQDVFDKLMEDKAFAPFAAYQKGMALALVGDFEAADEVLSSKADRGFASSRRGVIARAQILSQLERNEDATALLTQAFSAAPDKAVQEMLDALAKGETLPFDVVSSASDGVAETFLTLAGALGADPDEVFALIYARLGEYLRPEHTETLLMTATLLEAHKQFALSDALYSRVSEDHPSFLAAQLGRADALSGAEKTDEALAILQDLTQSHADEPLVWSSLGDQLRAQQKFPEAAKAYAKLIDLGEARGGAGWVAYYARGICLERSGEWARAVADFRKALEIEKDQPAVLNYLGYSYIDKGENLEEALSMIEKAVQAQPEDGAFLDSLGWGLYRLGRYEEAVASMEAAVELMSDDSLVNDHLGDVYWAAGRKREAEFQWKRALSFKPEKPEDAERMRKKLEFGLDKVLADEGAPPLKRADNADL